MYVYESEIFKLDLPAINAMLCGHVGLNSKHFLLNACFDRFGVQSHFCVLITQLSAPESLSASLEIK
jgi:hypothetical protein